MKGSFGTIVFGALLAVLALSSVAQAGAPLPGAIFTTTADGTIVNANVQFPTKCDVYLDGGPGPNAPAKAAGLPAGDYYFQVTDPSGHTLLSTDVVTNRQFRVSDKGVITGYMGFGGPAHDVGIDQDHPELGAVTIRLANSTCPADYLDTPNDGGVYKVWVTRVSDFSGNPNLVDNNCGNGCFHGFVPSKSKTDNFKVRPTIPIFCLTVAKLLDFGEGDPGFEWPIQVTDPTGVTNPYFTNDTNGTVSICNLVAGSYTVTELPKAGFEGYKVAGLFFNGSSLPAQTSYSFDWAPGQPAPVVKFQNKASIE